MNGVFTSKADKSVNAVFSAHTLRNTACYDSINCCIILYQTAAKLFMDNAVIQ